MGTPYLGEIRMVAFGFAPKGWAMCNGQSMPINQNQPLFALLGTTYGGNGVQTFQLPDFRGRTSFHVGSGYVQGQAAGEEMHVLAPSELPMHTHLAMGSGSPATASSPSGNFWANGVNQYSTQAINATMAGTAIGNNSGGQAHENRSPYQVVNFIIALTGLFPSPN